MEYELVVRGVGDSLFVIDDLRRLRYRTLRALEFQVGAAPGFRSAPLQALRYCRAPRAKLIQPLIKLHETFLQAVLPPPAQTRVYATKTAS